jgi:hypothetical protein
MPAKGPGHQKNVFVVCRPEHDVSPATAFGVLRFLAEARLSQSEAARVFWTRLAAESSPQDYLLTIGPAYLQNIASGILACLHGRLRLLLCQPASHTYKDYDFYFKDLLHEHLTQKESPHA